MTHKQPPLHSTNWPPVHDSTFTTTTTTIHLHHGRDHDSHHVFLSSRPAPPPPMPLSFRIPYTDPLPAPKIIPHSASSFDGAVAALTRFLLAPAPTGIKPHHPHRQSLHAHLQHHPNASAKSNAPAQTLLLTGAGISVASGLADYRGTHGTYRLNKNHRPIFFHEFCQDHEARKRYWARSFLGWEVLRNKRPNAAHHAVAKLGELGIVGRVITQSTPTINYISFSF